MEIKISKSAQECHRCEARFEHEQRIVSSMRRGDEGFVREDYCPGCWNDETAADAFCMWSAQFQDPGVLDQQPNEAFSPLRQVFYENAEGEGREAIALAYLAGQLLRRQKVFRFIKQTADPDTDAVVFLFSDRIGNRLIEVHDPNLTTGELDRARKELLRRLAELEGTLEDEGALEDGAMLDEADTGDETEVGSESHGESKSELAQT